MLPDPGGDAADSPSKPVISYASQHSGRSFVIPRRPPVCRGRTIGYARPLPLGPVCIAMRYFAFYT